MFHLLGDVYVDHEVDSDQRSNQINLSQWRGFQWMPGYYEFQGTGTQLGWATSLDEIKPGDFYAMFLRAVEFRDKVIVYADSESYTRLYALLLLALFPNIDERTFRLFFICIKATYATGTVTLHDRSSFQEMTVAINRKVVQELWDKRKTDPLVKPMRQLVEALPEKTSLEWRILRMMATKDVGTIPDTIRNLMRRTAMSNSLDAMDDWGRVIADPTRWSVSGATEETLLDSDSIFQACVNFGDLANPTIRNPDTKKIAYTNQWYIDLLENIVKVLTDCGDLPSAGRSARLRELFMDETDVTVYENMLARLQRLFDGGNDNFRLGHSDSIKYNENLIRLAVRMSDEQIKALCEGSPW